VIGRWDNLLVHSIPIKYINSPSAKVAPLIRGGWQLGRQQQLTVPALRESGGRTEWFVMHLKTQQNSFVFFLGKRRNVLTALTNEILGINPLWDKYENGFEVKEWQLL
jgi:hypothetical protein